MARNDGVDRTSVRNLAVSDKAVGNTQQHNEREKDSYRNPDIIPQRTAWNIHFKKPTASYTDLFAQLETAGTISTRGLKPDATHYCELVFDVNSAYFDNHGGYEFAKQFYEDAYKAAVQIVGGEQYILSAVMHADEINRASPKTQSALLEVMQEGKLSVDGKTYPVPQPFIVMATQNPYGSSGTQELPDSQTDRFMIRITVGYPSAKDEIAILKHENMVAASEVEAIVSAKELMEMRKEAAAVHVEDSIYGYMVNIANASRTHADVSLGISPRGTMALSSMSKAHALMEGRDYVIPDDVLSVAPYTLTHRLTLTGDARFAGKTPGSVLASILSSVPRPSLKED